jgi:hypothetical protein
MIRSCYDKVYHSFKEGDEVYIKNSHFKAIKLNNPYTVLKCYKPLGYIDGYPSDRFLKTKRQLREDRIKEIIND